MCLTWRDCIWILDATALYMDTGTNYPLHGHWTSPQDVFHVDIFSLIDCLLNDTIKTGP